MVSKVSAGPGMLWWSGRPKRSRKWGLHVTLEPIEALVLIIIRRDVHVYNIPPVHGGFHRPPTRGNLQFRMQRLYVELAPGIQTHRYLGCWELLQVVVS